MANIPNAGNYRDRLPPQRRSYPQRANHPRHRPHHRHHGQHQPLVLPTFVSRALLGIAITLVIFLLWGRLGILLALVIGVGIVLARHAWRH